MKIVRQILRSRYTLAVVAGFLLACSFPNIGIAGLAWIAPALMLAAAFGTTPAKSFRFGYLAAFTHYLVSLSWLLDIPYRWHSIPIGPAVGWIALSAFLSLFPAAWVWAAWKILPAPNRIQSERWWAVMDEIAAWSWPRRWGWPLICAAGWVAMEMVVARIFGGFPWNLLGASQYELLPVIQFASITGVYGVSFLIAWTATSLLCAAALIIRQPSRRGAWIGAIILPLTATLAAFFHGNHRLLQTATPDRTLRMALIQPSIPQTLIWDPDASEMRFEELIRLSEAALTNEVDVLVWPEAAIPGLLRYEREILDAVTGLARRHRVWMIVGADDAEPRKSTADPQDADYYNSSFLISPDGELMNRYRKRNLVMFGEYIPLTRWLPFIKALTPWMPGSFTPGDEAVPFELAPTSGVPNGSSTGNPVITSVLICFEDNFPHLVVDYARPDTDFLLNLTNNGWFGESAAQWQHAANAVFRAIENRIPLVRCTNNGLTCWVDTRGQLRQVFRDPDGSEYGKGILHLNVPLTGSKAKESRTFYNQHGDWFGWICSGIFAGTLFFAVMRVKFTHAGTIRLTTDQ